LLGSESGGSVCEKERDRWLAVEVVMHQDMTEFALYVFCVTNWRIIQAMVALHNLYPSKFVLSLAL
jgi:hypothetical protein